MFWLSSQTASCPSAPVVAGRAVSPAHTGRVAYISSCCAGVLIIPTPMHSPVRLGVGEAGEDWNEDDCAQAKRQCFGSELRDYQLQGCELPRVRQSVLLTTLVVQLVAALSGPVCVCSNCGHMYEPTRRPCISEENFCEEKGCKKRVIGETIKVILRNVNKK